MSISRGVAILLGTLLALFPVAGLGDGWELTNGRFPEGKVTVLTLTAHQIAYLDLIHRCHRDNTKTPYLFRLTSKQARTLKRAVHKNATRFVVFDSYRGEKGVDITLNVAVRFESSRIEIPHALVESDAEVHKYETAVIGWAPNKLANTDPARVRPGTCP